MFYIFKTYSIVAAPSDAAIERAGGPQTVPQTSENICPEAAVIEQLLYEAVELPFSFSTWEDTLYQRPPLLLHSEQEAQIIITGRQC